MNKEIISSKQGISLIVLFIMGSATVISPGVEAKQDVWLSDLFALLLALPVILIYARILSLYPNKDLFDILIKVFGKISGSTICLLYIWYSFHLGAIIMRNFSEFIHLVSLPRTPQLIIVLFTGLICIWFVRAGVEVIGRWAGFFLPIILFIVICTVILTFTQADLDNLRPVLYNGFKPIFKGAYLLFSFPLGETVIFMLVIWSSDIKVKTYKVFTLGLISGTAILLTLSVRNILVLGVETSSTLYFPTYSAVSMTKIGTFLERIEIVVAVVFILTGIAKIGICLYGACNGIVKVFKFTSNKEITAPIGLLMMSFSCFMYSSTMEMFEWASKVYPYYAIPFQIILPLIIWITAEIKLYLSKHK